MLSGVHSSRIEQLFAKYEKFETRGDIAHKAIKPDYVINVANQNDFDQLNSKLIDAIGKGYANIRVSINKGTYYYSEGHIYVHGKKADKQNVSIEGNNAVLIAQGRDFTKKSKNQITSIPFGAGFLTDRFHDVNLYGTLQYMESPVEVVDRNRKICRFHTDYQPSSFSSLYVQISQWYQCKTYPVSKIENGYVYFIDTALSYESQKKQYNINFDIYYSGKNPRYAFFNAVKNDKVYINEGTIHFPEKISSLHLLESSKFLTVYKCSFASFEVRGLTFLGNAQNKTGLLYFLDNHIGETWVHDNTFKYLRSNVMACVRNSNMIFSDNRIDSCYAGGITSDLRSENCFVYNNSFSNMGLGNAPSRCISCRGRDYCIKNNTFYNFSKTAIGVGVTYNGEQPDIKPRGVIDNNHIYYTDEYKANRIKHTFIDGGAIYVSSCSEYCIIRNNCIINYSGVKSCRGIYCDDGARNVKIYGNVIGGVENAHAVFSWRSQKAEKINAESNSGIDFFWNIIMGDYKFSCKPNSTSVQGENLILYSKEKSPELKAENFAHRGNDYLCEGGSIVGNKLKIPFRAKLRARKYPTYQKMKYWLK